MSAKSQQYRELNKALFRKLDGGKFGGYRTGVKNGPDPTRKPRDKKSKP